jgi:beta-lactam-binding protein with PASTA domain
VPAKARLLLAAALVALVAAAVVGLSLRGHGEEAFVDSVVLVPVVVGQSEQDAIAAIKDAGLQPEVSYDRRIRAVRRGMPRRVVISQGGSARITSKGQPVRLVVAIAPTRRAK